MLAVLIFLICFGLVMLFSTSSYSALIKQGDSMFYLKRQLIFCVVGFLGMIIVSTIDYHNYIKLKTLINKPIVAIDLIDKEAEDYVNVGLQDENGGYIMTKYLLEKGRKTKWHINLRIILQNTNFREMISKISEEGTT